MIAHVTVATAGHIDHGKSTLVEALTGVHPDRLKEEQVRGISIELGFAHARIDDVIVSFVDVPGHERFVRHMLAGVGGIDVLLCVVAADESVMPQTREHLAIAGLLGVRGVILAITKSDLVDTDLRDLVALEAEEVVRAHGLDVRASVAVSARSGVGLDRLRAAIVDAARQRQARDLETAARLPVDRAFTVRGFGTVVTGTLWTGRLRIDDEVQVLPGGGRFRVRGLQVHGQTADQAEAGQRVAVNLAQATLDDVPRGSVLAADGDLLVSRRLDATVAMLPDAPPLRHGARVHVHLGTAVVLARVALLEADEDARHLPPGARGTARLRLEAPLPLRRGDRFVLRSYSPVTTVGGGRVIDPAPPRRLSRAAAAARLARLARDPDDPDALRALLTSLAADAAGETLAIADLAPRVGVPRPRLAAVLATADPATLVVLGDRLVHADAITDLRRQVLADVDAHLAAEPESDGLPRQSVRQRRGRRADPTLVEHVVTALLDEGTLAVERDRLTRPAHRQARAAHAAASGAARAAAQRAGLHAATREELLAAMQVPAATGEAVLRQLVRDQRLVLLGGLYVDGDAVARLVDDLRTQQAAGAVARLDVGWFKERYGVTRRTAIPLLEWLDRQRVTRRVGDARIVLAP